MARNEEAFGAYYFSVEIEGVQSAFFRSVTGLKSESEVIELAEGGVNTTTHRLIGRTKYPNLVLKQGFCNAVLWDKRERFLNDEPGKQLTRFSGSIKQLGPGGKVVSAWQFKEGWICKWDGPDYDASKNEVSIETIEIAHHGLKHSK